ncbi:T9SS type A sorting domain-containing protein [uncultured Algibacter sp.]|uniref:T9SS type A sorting domain-containing protein n=1 Tax=uncultured Algibacter sp. TaxID=298659 RepID=UPI00262C6A97|nr:T9SS type A sorting domain-containing protein [uncultured Algibacter sp.]
MKSQEYKIDSLQVFQWNNPILTNDWYLLQRSHYNYIFDDAFFSGAITFIKEDTPNLWRNSNLFIFSYGGENLDLTQEIYKFWDNINMVWVNISKSEYSYDGDGNNDIKTNYTHATDWVLSSQELKTYNGDNLVIENILQLWNSNMVDWVNDTRSTHAFNGSLITKDEFFSWNGVDDWNIMGDSKSTYTYNGSLVTEILSETNIANTYTNSSKQSFTYNGTLLDENLNEDWDDISSSWVKSTRSVYTHGVNDQWDEIIFYDWINSAWVENFKTKYFWSEKALSTNKTEFENAKTFPNPTQDFVNISLASPTKENSELLIYNTEGKQLSKSEINKGTQYISFNINNFKNGMYFIKVISQEQITTFKVIKE